MFALVACGGGSSLSIDDFLPQLQTSECTAVVDCDEVPDTATCDASLTLESTELETVVAEVKAGIVKYDGGAADECLSFLTSNACTYRGAHATNPCLQVFDGTIAIGGDCLEDEACAGYSAQTASCVQTTSTCDRSTSCCPGVCTAVPAKAAAGATCATSNDCDTGLYCSDLTTTCKALVATAGGACEATDGCTDPMFCNEDFQTMMGTCITPAASGATCDPTVELACGDERQHCDATTMKCTDNAAIGAACSTTIPCVADATCDTTSSTCVAIPGPGDACTTTTRCLGDLQCVSSVCTLPASTAMTCM